MSESLWSASADELLRRTASSDATPGGGSIAAVSGALGVGLVLMAVAVTADQRLDPHRARLESLLARVRHGADDDVDDFEAVMAAYRMPKGDAARAERLQEVTTVAAIRPLEVAQALVDAAAVARTLRPLVKPSIRSDVEAGIHLALGAAKAALETSMINQMALERMGDAAVQAFEQRAGELARLDRSTLDRLELL